MSIQQVNQEVVRNTRLRTTEAWKALGKDPNVPTTVMGMFACIVERLEDLEEALGYEPEYKPYADLHKVDTQGR